MASIFLQFNATVEDAKGEKSVVSINALTDDTNPLSSLAAMAAYVATFVIEPVITGVVRTVNVSVPRLAEDFITEPPVTADIEEGALFVWRTDAGVTGRNRLPTFDETKIIDGSRLVDLTDTDVQNFVTFMTDGHDSGTWALYPVDSRSANILALESAKEQFVRSRA